MNNVFTVWVGGAEVNDSLMSEKDASDLAYAYVSDGYDDVVIQNTVDFTEQRVGDDE